MMPSKKETNSLPELKYISPTGKNNCWMKIKK